MGSLQTETADITATDPKSSSALGRGVERPSPAKWLLTLTINWAPALAIMTIIFFLSSKPDFGGPAWVSALIRDLLGEGPVLDRIEWLLPYADTYASWLAHFIEYGALGIAFYWGIRRQWPWIRRAALLAWGLVLIYGLSDELHQGFVPGRHPDYRDILTDAAGGALALFLLVSLERLLARLIDRWRGSRGLRAGE